MTQTEFNEALEKLESNVEVMKDDESTQLEKGVAAEQSKHNAEAVYELFKELE